MSSFFEQNKSDVQKYSFTEMYKDTTFLSQSGN